MARQGKVLVLTKDDIKKESINKSLDDISIGDVKPSVTGLVIKHDIVMFDNGKSITTIKDRYQTIAKPVYGVSKINLLEKRLSLKQSRRLLQMIKEISKPKYVDFDPEYGVGFLYIQPAGNNPTFTAHWYEYLMLQLADDLAQRHKIQKTELTIEDINSRLVNSYITSHPIDEAWIIFEESK